MTIRRRTKSIPGDRVYLGKITRPHALRGEVKFQAYGCDPWLLEDLGSVHTESPDMILEVDYVRGTAKAPIIKFKSIDDRSGSESLSGMVVWVVEEVLPELDENHIYESQILDYRILTSDGCELGRVVEVMETGEFDVLVVRNDKQEEWLVPANHEVIKDIRTESKEIVVDLPEGLFESQQ
jgi:16S rRNA processing protein RimM